MEAPALTTNRDIPGESGIFPGSDAATEQLIRAALRRYLAGGATVVKDAPRLPKGYFQYALPEAGSIFPMQAPDVNGHMFTMGTEGMYIVTMVPEVQNVRYTATGAAPSSSYGMLVAVGQYIDIALMDPTALQFAGVQSGAIINLDVYGIQV